MDMQELYDLAHEVPEHIKDENKYAWLGYHKAIEMRYIDINDSLTHKTPINGFINDNAEVLLIPNIINNEIVDLSIKALNSKKILVYNKYMNFPYNIGNLDGFKYGDPLVLVEGIADLAGIKLIRPDLHVVALKTNDIPKGMYEFYASLTNRIILLLDNDDAAKKQISRIMARLKEKGINVENADQLDSLKDTGEIIEYIMKYKISKDELAKEKVQLAKEYYNAIFNLLIPQKSYK
jgi:hypothetical protein